MIEDLDFADAREQGRERAWQPAFGADGADGASGALVAGIPTGKIQDRLAQMAANAGLR